MSNFDVIPEDLIRASIDYAREVQEHYEDVNEASEIVNRVFEAVQPGMAQLVTLALLRGSLGSRRKLTKRVNLNRHDINKIAAIKSIRSLSHLTLKEAKDLVEEAMDMTDCTYKIVDIRNDITSKEYDEYTAKLREAGFKFY